VVFIFTLTLWVSNVFKRKNDHFLDTWLNSKHRRPLILRGARQIGKSTAVRRLAERQGRELIEVDLERHSTLNESFARLDVEVILQDIQLLTRKRINPHSVLFLDEAQGAPKALAALRYFYEQRPDIPVIAAGSLLEFALAELDSPMPVGRVDFARMHPVTFCEYLSATGREFEIEILRNFASGQTNSISPNTHAELMKVFCEYVLVGGMPSAIVESMEHAQAIDRLSAAALTHERLLHAFRDDFSKYQRRISTDLLRRIFDTIPTLLGQVKVKFSALAPNERTESAKRGLDALISAGLVRKVTHTPARGIPLSAGSDANVFKLVPLDVGLSSTRELGTIRTLTLPSSLFVKWESGNTIERQWMGQLAECVVGQSLLACDESNDQLFYWLRGGKSANAELDYVVQSGTSIVPVEVKAGSSGTLKSLHQFMAERQLEFAIRFDINAPVMQKMDVQTLMTGGVSTHVNYTLHSLPLYLSDFIYEYIRTRHDA
jgi:predicted AAA+ superfamily ATPase